MKKLSIALVICMVLSLSACGTDNKSQRTVEENKVEQSTEAESSTEVESSSEIDDESYTKEEKTDEKYDITIDNSSRTKSAAFAVDSIYNSTNANILYSPLSLDMALGLVAEGSTGDVREQLDNYLGTNNYSEYASQYIDRASRLNSEFEGFGENNDGAYNMAFDIANSLWVSQNYSLLDEYKDRVTEYYSAEVDYVDMSNSGETANRVNNWCSEKTHGLIPQILDPSSINIDTRAVLVNSVYLETPWIDNWGTFESEFTNINVETTTQEMLCDKLDLYYENEYATAFAKYYSNGLKFIGILPKDEGEFSLESLDIESLLASETTKYDVDAVMPKLNYNTSTNQLVNILKEQGVIDAFTTGNEDITGIVNDHLYISDIIQNCKIELDENGTRAAAVTAVITKTNSIMPIEEVEVKEVHLDRPFAFIIYDEEMDQIVFIGKVVTIN